MTSKDAAQTRHIGHALRALICCAAATAIIEFDGFMLLLSLPLRERAVATLCCRLMLPCRLRF